MENNTQINEAVTEITSNGRRIGKKLFLSVMQKISEKKGFSYEFQLAAYFGMHKSSFSERKKSCSLPMEKLKQFCREENVSMEWLLTVEKKKRDNTAVGALNLAAIMDWLKNNPDDLEEVWFLVEDSKHRQKMLELSKLPANASN